MNGAKLSVLSLSFVAATGMAQVTLPAGPRSPGATAAISGESKCATLRKSYDLALFVKILSGGAPLTCRDTTCPTELYLSENKKEKKCYVTYKHNEISIPETENAPDDCSKRKSRSKVKKLTWELAAAPIDRVFPGAEPVEKVENYRFDDNHGIELVSGNSSECDLHDGGHDVAHGRKFKYHNKHYRVTGIQYCPHVVHTEWGKECEAWDPFIFNQ